jgi:hypothetical protein
MTIEILCMYFNFIIACKYVKFIGSIKFKIRTLPEQITTPLIDATAQKNT